MNVAQSAPLFNKKTALGRLSFIVDRLSKEVATRNTPGMSEGLPRSGIAVIANKHPAQPARNHGKVL